jgi:hypothetical protein
VANRLGKVATTVEDGLLELPVGDGCSFACFECLYAKYQVTILTSIELDQLRYSLNLIV